MASGLRSLSSVCHFLVKNRIFSCRYHGKHVEHCNLVKYRSISSRSISILRHPIKHQTHQGVRQHHLGNNILQVTVNSGRQFSTNRTPLSSGSQQDDAAPSTEDPFSLVENDLASLCSDIQDVIQAGQPVLRSMTHYHFDGTGKSFRPMIVLLMARACNSHQALQQAVLSSQRRVAMIAEMIHTASLVHDDVIDSANTRRGKPSVQGAWGQKHAIVAGDFIMSASSMALARIRNIAVVKILSQVLEDLVTGKNNHMQELDLYVLTDWLLFPGEFMQLGSKEDETERFNHYLTKTYKKTASLIANSCKAVAVLANCDKEEVDIAFAYGRNIGIAFQLVDDLLDFVSSEAMMGKPTAADLKLGLATAPVLFAAHQHPELNALIMRRFSRPGDVYKARELVSKSDGVSHTRYLAQQHCSEATRQISQLAESPERNALISVTHKVLNRLK